MIAVYFFIGFVVHYYFFHFLSLEEVKIIVRNLVRFGLWDLNEFVFKLSLAVAKFDVFFLECFSESPVTPPPNRLFLSRENRVEVSNELL